MGVAETETAEVAADTSPRRAEARAAGVPGRHAPVLPYRRQILLADAEPVDPLAPGHLDHRHHVLLRDVGDPVGAWIALGACAVAATLALSACAVGASTVCPAIGWSNTLTVRLADDWPPVDGGTLLVECSSRCGLHAAPTDEPDELSVPLTGTSTVVQLDMTSPDSVVLTVLGPDGTELAQVGTDLDWRRVGGTEECGGPSAASVLVPAP
jgi:hypothetical protein